MSSLPRDLYHAIRTREPLEGLVELLEDFRDSGGSREEARSVLQEVRFGLHGDEARLVDELLDRVTGFCHPGDRIWPDPVHLG